MMEQARPRKPLLALLVLLFPALILALLSGPVAVQAAPAARAPQVPTTSLTLNGLSNGLVISRYRVTNTSALPTGLSQTYYNTSGAVVWSSSSSLAPHASRQVSLDQANGLPPNYQGYALLSATQPITAHLLSPIYRVQQVAVTGPIIVPPTIPAIFTAKALPISSTLPLTFTWETAGRPALIHSKQSVTDTATFSWPTTGLYPLTVTIAHPWGEAATVYMLRVAPLGDFQLWLPLLASQSQDLPAHVPADPVPASGSRGVGLGQMLAWSSDDPGAELLSFDVYLGAGSGPPEMLICENVREPVCTTGPLEAEALYTWQVIAESSNGQEMAGPLWSFTTRRNRFEAGVEDLVNYERAAEAGCGPVTADSRLAAAASGHSLDMAENDFFSHTGSHDSTFISRALAQGYDYWELGENIAAGYPTPEDVVAGWMNSPSHRDNILNCNFTDIGVGYVYQDPDPGAVRHRHYWTQMFGKPR